MILLRPNVAELGRLVAEESARFSMTGVMVKEADGGYEAAATVTSDSNRSALTLTPPA